MAWCSCTIWKKSFRWMKPRYSRMPSTRRFPMGRSTVELDWAQLSGFIASAMGLHFPQERWPDLQRGMSAAAAEFGFEDISACTKWLLSSPLGKEQLQVLASHLTIGETYFFRDKKTFEIVASNVLPALIHA